MAKNKRLRIGSIYKGKDGKPDYIKLNMDVNLTKNTYLSLESKQSQLTGLDQAEADGKISAENAAKARERIQSIPDFVRFELVLVKPSEG